MDIGLIGFGGVGQAFIRLLGDKEKYLLEKYNLSIRIKYIIKSNGGIYDKDGINLKSIIKILDDNKSICSIKDFKDITIDDIVKNNDIDTLVELTSTNIVDGEPGCTHIIKALENDINVVTGNKGPIIIKYKELKALAEKRNKKLMVGCTTGGALPSISGGVNDVAGAKINSIKGILNGTTNYILTEMLEKDISYEKALKEAQVIGIAEANPRLDVEGYDTACKISILANVILGIDIKLQDISIEGITEVDNTYLRKLKEEGKKLKLIGTVNDLGVKVSLEELNSENPLYFVDGKNKGILYDTDTLGEISIMGGASGTTNAAASILRDIINM